MKITILVELNQCNHKDAENTEGTRHINTERKVTRVRYDILTTTYIMNTVLWDATLNNKVDGSQTTWHHIPVDYNLNVTCTKAINSL